MHHSGEIRAAGLMRLCPRHCERSDLSAVAQRAKAEAIQTVQQTQSGLLRRFAPRNDDGVAV
jgi:hypothetical protein